MPAGEDTRLSRFLRRHDHGARYEVASATAVKAAQLIARDGRPVLLLDALAASRSCPWRGCGPTCATATSVTC